MLTALDTLLRAARSGSLSAEDAERADAAGRSLTITQALDLARLPVLSA